MNEIEQVLERQAAWQRARARLPWAEKPRLSVVMRAAMKQLRRANPRRCVAAERRQEDPTEMP